MSALEKETYRYVGQMIAVSIIHGGLAPTFLAPSIVHYILKGIRRANPEVKEVPSVQVINKLEEASIVAYPFVLMCKGYCGVCVCPHHSCTAISMNSTKVQNPRRNSWNYTIHCLTLLRTITRCVY